MNDGDHALILLDEARGLRVRVVALDEVVANLLARHAPTPAAAHAIARAAVAVALYPTSFKELDRVSFQISGNGPLGSVFAEMRAPGTLRAMVRDSQAIVPGFDDDDVRGSGVGIGRAGVVSVLRQDREGRVSNGQILLSGGRVDDDVQGYFAESEQIETRVRVRFDRAPRPRARGVLVQVLPGGDARALPDDATLDRALTLDDDTVALARSAFGEAPLRVIERVPLSFACTCSRDRVRASFALLDDALLQAAIVEDEGASVRCDFCAEEYTFTRADLEEVARERALSRG